MGTEILSKTNRLYWLGRYSERVYTTLKLFSESFDALIEEYGGLLPFNDKADPEQIKKEAEMSKNAFKRAVGRLLKEGRVEITPHGIRSI